MRLRRAVVLTALTLSLLLTALMTVLVLPVVADVFEALPELVLFGLLLVLSTSTRVMAGVFAARRWRRSWGTDSRTEVLPSVALGVALAWLVYVLLVALAGAAVGDPLPWSRLLLELPRWLLEGLLGAALVTPGEPERLDPSLRKYSLSRRGGQ